MKDSFKFLQNTLWAGFTIILPLIILFTVLNWAFGIVLSVMKPFTESFVSYTGTSLFLAHVLVALGFVSMCFILGYYTKTKQGKRGF